MKLTDFNLSYPYIEYEVNISHITSRRSTAIEWLILETVSYLEQEISYQSLSIEDFYSKLFGISDTNKIIKPVLIELRELGALFLDNVYDDIDLRETPMNCIHLTEDGRLLQKVGKLPGNRAEDTFGLYYDVAGQKITQKSNAEEESKGVKVSKIESADEVAFPLALIQQEILALGSQNKLKWYNEGTEILQITPVQSALKWKTVRRNLCINDDFTIFVEGVSEPGINEEVLDIYSAGSNLQRLPEVPFTSLSELSMIGEQSSAEVWVHDAIEKTRIYIADVQYYSSQARPYSSEKGEYNVIILSGCDSLEVKVDKKGIFARIPEQILPTGNKFLSTDCQISLGTFLLRTGNSKKTVNLAYSVNKLQEHFSEILVGIIDKYSSKELVFIFLYHALGQISEFNQCVKNYINSRGNDVDTKLNAINSLNDTAILLYGKKCILDDEVKRLLVNREQIASEVHDVQSAIKVLHRYTDSNIVKRRETLVEEIIHTVLACIEPPYSLKELHQLWQTITGIGKRYINCVNRNNWYDSLYTTEVLTELAENFGSEDLYAAIEEYTPYEILLRDIQSVMDRCQELLPEISFAEVQNTETIKAQLIANSDKVKELYRMLDEWYDATDNDREFLSFSRKLRNVAENFSSISDALSMYYRNVDSFNKICILDTNVMMNDPEILALFENTNTMVVIPVVVLTELDNLKDDENEEKAYQARRAIRQINNYHAYEWVNMQEESAPELLSKDMEPERPDNKIISVALKFIVKSPLVISDDNNLRNLAVSQKLEAISSESFRQKLLHEHEEQPGSNKKKKTKKKKK